MLVVERGDDLVHFPALLGERDAHRAAVDARAGMVKISHLDQLLDVIGDVRAEIVAARAKLARGQLLIADIVEEQRLDRIDVDVNSVQALLLYNIGDKELTAGELRTRGYYLGSNVSYNVKKLVEMGYLHHARSRVDRRSVRISLAEKGREVHKIVASLYDKHVLTVEQIGGVSADEFKRMNQALGRLERFSTDQIRYGT